MIKPFAGLKRHYSLSLFLLLRHLLEIMGLDPSDPATPTRRTSNAQTSNGNDDETPYRKGSVQENSGRRGRKDGSAKRTTLPRATRQGY